MDKHAAFDTIVAEVGNGDLAFPAAIWVVILDLAGDAEDPRMQDHWVRKGREGRKSGHSHSIEQRKAF